MAGKQLVLLRLFASIVVATMCGVPASGQEAKPVAIVEKAWYTPIELLTALAQRDGIQWALPETLAGRALVGEAATTDDLLDKACQQWGLSWNLSNGVIVVHRASDERLKKWTSALAKGEHAAAWELGWLRDGRALPPLADALAGKDVAALALAAAQAIEVLDTMVPLGPAKVSGT